MMVGGSITAVIIIAGGYATARWGVQRVARDEVAETLRSRLGVESEIDEVLPGLASLTLIGIRSKDSKNKSLSFEIPRAVIRFRLLALLWGGSDFVESITLDGLAGSVVLAGDSPSFFSDLFSGHGRGGSGKSVAGKRSVAANGISLEVSDRGGELIRVQDVAVIPMLAVLPLLAVGGIESHASAEAAHGAARGWIESVPGWGRTLVVVGAVAAIVVGGQFLVRPIFRFIARTGLREIFTAAGLLLVIGIALLMEQVGLSPALGTFVAGVVLAESEYRHELEADIEPFKGLLLGLFFIAVGASIDFNL